MHLERLLSTALKHQFTGGARLRSLDPYHSMGKQAESLPCKVMAVRLQIVEIHHIRYCRDHFSTLAVEASNFSAVPCICLTLGT